METALWDKEYRKKIKKHVVRCDVLDGAKIVESRLLLFDDDPKANEVKAKCDDSIAKAEARKVK